MKKIIFLLESMNIGGTEKSLLNLLDTLPQEDYDITILLFSKTGGLLSGVPVSVKVDEIELSNSESFELYNSPKKILFTYIKEFRILRTIQVLFWHFAFRIFKDRTLYYQFVLKKHKYKSIDYDCAIAYSGPADLVSTYVLNCVDAKEKIQWIHFDVSKYEAFHKSSAKRLYPRFDKIFAVSNEAAESLIQKLPCVSDKVKVVKNVINPERCRQLAEVKNGFDDSYKGLRILTVGRLSPEKGQDIIPEIARCLVESNIDFRWYVLGNGSLKDKIVERIKSNNLSDRVILLGATDNPYPLFNESDIYVQTSLHEGFCITLAEAKVFDLKIVSTDCKGAHEQLDEYSKAIIVNRNVDEIYNAINNLIKN